MALINFYDMYNLTAPADGKTHMLRWDSLLPGGTDEYAMSSLAQSYGSDFKPQLCRLDNTQSTTEVEFLNTLTGTRVLIPAGMAKTFMLEAVNNAVFRLTGTAGSPVFVKIYDFPGFPWEDTPPAAPIPVPLEVAQQSFQSSLISAAFSASGSTAVGTPAGTNGVNKIAVSIPGNAIQAAAGQLQITVLIAGVAVAVFAPFVPAAALDTAGELFSGEVGFDTRMPLPVGAVTISLSAALTAGTGLVNVYSF